MSDVMIKVEDLAKKYIISHEGGQCYMTLRDKIASKAKTVLKNNKYIPVQRRILGIKGCFFRSKAG